MNLLTNNPIKGNEAEGASSKKGWQNIGNQLKSFFRKKSEGQMLENEIDYYHQYIYPHKVNKLLKNKVEQKHTTYIPFAKRN